MLRELASDLWVTERPQRFFGVEMGTRMTVVRLREGDLWLHSPVRLDAELREALEARGRVRFAVAPSRLHHLYAGGVPAAWPEARLYGAPGLPGKRRDLRFHGVLSDAAPPEWEGQIDQLCFRSMPVLNEVLFFHRASRTLVMTDLSVYARRPLPLSMRLFLLLVGRPPDSFGPTRMERWFLRDRPAARAALERVLAWDFDRVVVAHGDVLERGGREALRSGYHWLLRA